MTRLSRRAEVAILSAKSFKLCVVLPKGVKIATALSRKFCISLHHRESVAGSRSSRPLKEVSPEIRSATSQRPRLEFLDGGSPESARVIMK